MAWSEGLAARSWRSALVAVAALSGFLSFSTGAHGLEPLEVRADRSIHGAVPPVEVAVDPTGRLAFDDLGAHWSHASADALNVGYSTAAHWARFELKNTGDTAGTWLVQSFRTNDATLFDVGPDGPRERSAGAGHPYGSREIAYADPTFRVRLGPGETARYHLRARGADVLDLTPKIWAEPEFREQAGRENVVAGAYYALMVTLVLYNLFIYLGTRDRPYRWYVVFQLAFASMQASFDGWTFRFLWPSHPSWASRSEIVFAGLTLVGASLFARSFLAVERHTPRAARLLTYFSRAGLGLALVGLVTSHTLVQQAGYALLVSACLVLVGTGVLSWIRKDDNAPYYTLSWAAILAGTALEVLTLLGVLPHVAVPTLWTRLGSAGEALLLSFGLANRVNLVRRERDAAVAHRERAQRERLAALSRLVSGVAHEIANPLTMSVGGMAALRRDLASAGHDPASRTSKALALVDAGNERITAIVRDLRAYSRASTERNASADASAEITSALERASALTDAARVTVTTDLATSAPCRCAPQELRQALGNLIANACQAMPDGGELRVGSRVDGETVVVDVSDSGTGVPEDLRESIFEPFFTTREPGAGSGLGLSVAHEIVARNGGDLTLEPSDRGASFRIRLPRSA